MWPKERAAIRTRRMALILRKSTKEKVKRYVKVSRHVFIWHDTANWPVARRLRSPIGRPVSLSAAIVTCSFHFYRVLVFPPVNNYRRYIIHQLVQDRFPDLHTFSIGQGSARRTVVCYKSDVIRYSSVYYRFSDIGAESRLQALNFILPYCESIKYLLLIYR